ncbi:hypothetical protein H2C83_06155 [Thermoactinomyces sp. AMNI-1]|uniref:Uncharacterized protein n=2 Tax=Thermoactinomyces mirandus TaxID=2756294 RepID=A0A7W1XRN4_9BACL|nr:hypothetical protein [Thermoactinomyces mirandus]
MLFKKRQPNPANEDAFMSFNFWLTLEEIEQLETVARDNQTDPAAVVQKIVKKTLAHWRQLEEGPVENK